MDKKLSLELDTNPRLTSDEIREALKQKIEIGLIYFLIESNISNKIRISLDSTISNNNNYSDKGELSSDKWKNWVFQSSGEADFENETSRKHEAWVHYAQQSIIFQMETPYLDIFGVTLLI